MSELNLAYAALGVEDVEAWAEFAQGVLGMQDAGLLPDGARALRIDERAYRVGLYPAASNGGSNDLLRMGFETSDAAGVARVSSALEKVGYAITPLSGAEADMRRVAGGVWSTDPGGLRVEVVHGFARAATPFCSPQGTQFETGALGFGHLVVSAPDIDRSMAFYEALGLKISDYIETPLGPGVEVRLVFLHCNPRHHTLALLPLPTPRRMDHLMLEAADVDMVVQAYYRAQKAGKQIVRHLGRHTNDRMLSFYVRSPAGFDVEFGCGGVQIGEKWQVTTHYGISVWGHEA